MFDRSISYDELADLISEELSFLLLAHQRVVSIVGEDNAPDGEMHPKIWVGEWDALKLKMTDDGRYYSSVDFVEEFMHEAIVDLYAELSFAAADNTHTPVAMVHELAKQWEEYQRAFSGRSGDVLAWAFDNDVHEGEEDVGCVYKSAAERLIEWCRQAHRAFTNSEPLTIDADRFEVTQGSRKCRLGNTQEFRFARFLHEHAGRFVDTERIKEAIHADGVASIKHVKKRLVRELRGAGMGQLADAIHTQVGHYGLFPEPDNNGR